MPCAEVRDWLATRDGSRPVDLDAHLAGCAGCRAFAERAEALDRLVRPALLVAPPPALQARLAGLAQAGPLQPLAAPARPAGLVGWAVAAVLGALAVWQVVAWLPRSLVVGDIAAAVQILLASPVASYLDLARLDLSGLLLWSAVGAVGWLLSPSGPLRDLSARLGLPA